MGHIVDNAALRGVTLFSFHSLQNKYTQRWIFGIPHLSPSSAARQNWFCKCGKKWICRRRRARFSSFWFPPSPTDSFVTYFDEKNGTPQLLWPPAVLRRRLRCRAKYKDRGSCRSWATLLNLPSIADKRILRSLPYNDSQHSFLLVKP